MEAMAGIALKKQYQFIGILQPVLGMGDYIQSTAESVLDSGIIGRSAHYENFYPQLSQYIKNDTIHLRDFTHVFDTAKGEVFVDFCHIDEDYQKTIAQNVFTHLIKTNRHLSTVNAAH